jgi:Xaa-Pro aminopeptidase
MGVTGREVRERIVERLRRLLKRERLDAIVASSPENVFHLTGTFLPTIIPSRWSFVIVDGKTEPVFLCCAFQHGLARETSVWSDLRGYVEHHEDPADALAVVLRDRGLATARIGLEFRTLPAAAYLAVARALPQATLSDAGEILQMGRCVKEPEEVESLRDALKGTEAAVDAAVAGSHGGDTDWQFARRVLGHFLDDGAMPHSFVIGAGPASRVAHAQPTGYRLRPGDVMRWDLGARYPTKYLSDTARTAVVGRASPSQQRAFDALIAAQDEAFGIARPGVAAGSLFEACARIVQDRGFPFTMPHVGHGLGLSQHERPRLYPGCDVPLEAGMVLNVEPMVLLDDAGYAIEDLILVTEDGCEVLSRRQRTLLEIT